MTSTATSASEHRTIDRSAVGAEPRESGDLDLPARIQRVARPVVVESHFSGWEKPWRALSAESWRELLREFGERVDSAVVETGKNRELAVRYELEILPTVLVFLGGEVVARFTGHVRAEDVIAAVRSALEEARTLQSARQELEAVSASKDVLSPVRSLLRRRTSASSGSLARAG